METLLIIFVLSSLIVNSCGQGNITGILLLGGKNQTEGRVTIRYNGTYGTVCNDLFDLESANVVCRQLNFTGAVSVTSFGPGSGPIWLDDVRCNGTENSIEFCSHRGFGMHNCVHNDDVGVTCAYNDISPLQLRLVGGINEQQGRLEILYYGIWGYVCDQRFTISSANVACRRLGFPGALSVVRSYPVSGSGPLWLSHVECIGNESGIEQCSHRRFGNSAPFCGQYDDVGVVCIGNDRLNDTIKIRLVNGPDAHKGRVEILYAGVWGAICNDLFNLTAAVVVCRQLGYPGAVRILPGFESDSAQIWLDDVQCTGNETSIDQCSHNEFNIYDCNFETNQVGVECIDNDTTPLQLRLVGGINEQQGRLEILYYGIWGYVCDQRFTISSANVACRRLGFPGALSMVRSYPVSGSGPLWLSHVECIGNESGIEECSHRGFGNYAPFCGQYDDVGVVCIGNDRLNDTIQVRLVNGPDAHKGRVEILYAGEWGAICDDLFNLTAANVVCRQLGYPGAVHLLSGFGSDSAQIWLDDVQCTGNETSIDQCSHNGFNIYDCNFGTDQVGVECINNDTTPLQLRLVGGTNEQQGRLEILYYGIWGYVCDQYFTISSANVACRRLGFPGALSMVRSYPVSGSGPLWLSHVECIGNESGIEECSHRGFGNYAPFCGQYDDVGVVCIGNENINDTIQVRLVNGPDAHAGRVEIFYAGVWGAICKDLFNLTAANVLCRQLGYPGAVRMSSNYGSSTNQIWLDDVQCIGNETSIDQCSHNGFNIYDCDISRDQVGVECIDNDTASLAVRLVGNSILQGRIEILYYGVWGTICDRNFDLDNGNVACRRLGFPGAARVLRSVTGGSGQIWLDNVRCVGNETGLEHCLHNGFGDITWYCDHSDDVGVECLPNATAPIEVRLVNGQNESRGRIEVLYAGVWGTVCNDSFTISSANVVCRQLGFSGAVQVTSFGSGTGHIWLDEVQCTGTEMYIENCSHNEFGVHNCLHSNDAGVVCIDNHTMPLPIRLVGNSILQGRIEILYYGVWGTICDRNFDLDNGNVACRRLGFPGAARVLRSVTGGSGQIWLDNVRCVGNETGLEHCLHNGFGDIIWYCDHSDDVGVECLPNATAPIEVRLVGGQNASRGRIEVLYADVWGTVCNDSFTISSANVVCRELGFSGAVQVTSFGPGTEQIWLDEVQCTGTESSIEDCSHNEFGVHNCLHSNNAGVVCIVNEVDQLELRLVNGLNELHGRIEIEYYNVWGTICDDFFSIYSANVACRRLGYTAASRVITNIASGSGPIWMDNVQCIGNESSLEMCPHAGFGNSMGCSHSEDVGVECIRNITEPIQIQLLGGQDNYNGRVEIIVSDIRGTICNDSFTLTNAQVICRQLGFPGALSVESFGPGSGQIWLDDVQCTGDEVSIELCAHNGFGVHNCQHENDVGVVCIDNRTNPLPVRLVDGITNQTGRIEIQYNGVWGTICERNFDINSANVACRSLGFIAALRLVSTIRAGTGQIWLNNVQCLGNETSLEQCPHNGFGNHNCYHYFDIGVECIAGVTEPITIVLLNGQNENEGRVHILYGNVWGTICNHSFTLESANVLCRQLGYSGALEIASFGPGTGQIWLDELQCVGNETSIEQCPHLGFGVHNCFHSDDVGVKCIVDEIQPLPMRLVDGLYDYQGRIEIEYYGTWGTVCDDQFNLYSGNVVCRRLGFIAARSILTNVASGIGDIWLDDVQCVGNETSLELCPHNGFNTHNCDHYDDVGVDCIVNATNPIEIRLVNGQTQFEGRLEVLYAGIWGTVCSDFFSLSTANVVCRQLGFPGALWVADDQEFGIGRGQIWLDDVQCVGNESSIMQCSNNGFGIHNCQHAKDIGVGCIDQNNPPPPEFTIRLNGGRTQYEGRVEMFYSGRWGTVCIDEEWGINDARVICRQLNFTDADIAYRYSKFGYVRNPTWLGNLRCNGSERSVVDCARNDFKMNNCRYSADASVKCTKPFLKLTPSFGNMFGDTLIELSGMTFHRNAVYKCKFDDVMVNATYLNRDQLYCLSPSFDHTGKINFTLSVSGILEPFEMHSVFQSTPPFFDSEVNEKFTEIDFEEHRVNDFVYDMGNNRVMIKFKPLTITPTIATMFRSPYTVDFSLYSLNPQTKTRSFFMNLATDVPNTGSYEVDLPNIDAPYMATAVGASVSKNSITEFLNDVNNMINDGNQDDKTLRDIVEDITGFVENVKNVKKFFKNPVALAKSLFRKTVAGALYDAGRRLGCEAFCLIEPDNIGNEINQRLPPCPPTSNRARRDSQFTRENIFLEYAVVGTVGQCFTQSVFDSESGDSGQQCCYNRRNGRLKIGPPGGGTVQRYSPRKNPFLYALNDFLPRQLCCGGLFDNCDAFYDKRPSDNGSRYLSQLPACVYGDPHIITLDGLKYTFNGKGEFILIEDVANRFILQGRMIQAINTAQDLSRGTVFSTVVAKQNDSDPVQFEINEDGVTLDVLVDGDFVNFNDLFEQTFDNVIVTNLENNTIGATFSSGAYIEAKAENGIISVLIVSLPDSFKGTTRGLMGIYNDDTSDDLTARGSTVSLPADASLQEIHYEFGISWFIDHEEQSLFTYKQNFSWETYHDPHFEPLFEPTFSDAALEQQAMETCGDDTFCLYDVATTGRMDIGLSTLDGSQNFDELVELSYPVICDPPCVQGACVANDTCNCAEAYVGVRCTEPVYSKCDVNNCENGGTCVKLGVSYICQCVEGFSGILCHNESQAETDDNADDNHTDDEEINFVGIIGGAIAGVVTIILIIICCACCALCCCRKK